VSAIQAKKRGGKAGKVLEARKFTCRDCKRCFKIRVESNTAFPSVLLWSLCDLAIGPSDNHPSNCQTWKKISINTLLMHKILTASDALQMSTYGILTRK